MDDDDDDANQDELEFDDGLDDDEVMPRVVDIEAERRMDEAMGDWWALTRAVEGARATRIAVPNHPPYMLGRYEALDTVTGGMGMVVIGRDPDLERKVAMKLWKAEGPAAEAALLAEARTLTRFKHANIVSVFDVGKYKSSVYFVMESADGINGHDWIRDRAPTWQEVLEVFLAAGSGLAAAHVAGIQHRDFKPANMLVGDDGRVLVLDFGIAAALHSTNESSERGPGPEPADSERGPTGAGTVAYMAPERIRGRRGDARSDQFSFCVSMWEALHRVRPYRGSTSDVLLEAIACGAIRTGTSTAGVPHWLSRIVRKGLSEEPGMRYESMDDLLAALREHPVGGEAVDGELAEAALSGAPGRLLNAPGTAAHGGSAELDALVNEVAKRLQLKAGAPNDDEELLGFTGDRLARRQRQSRLLVFVSVISTVGVMFTMLLVGMMLRPATPVPSEIPPVAPVVQDPLGLVLEHVAADEFKQADVLWYANRRGSSLSDDDSLAIARACLNRAREHELADARTAREAAEMAGQVGLFLISFGNASTAREAGSQLYRDANALIRRLPAEGGPIGN